MTLIADSDPKAALQRLWWLTGLRGLFSIAWGIAAIAWPGITIAVLFMIFGAFTIVDGVIALVIGIFGGRTAWGWSIFQGIAGVVVGLLVLRYPQTVANVVVAIVALWALVIGLFQIALAVRLRGGESRNWLWVLASGLVTALLGLYFLINPDTGAHVLAVTIGIFAVIGGVFLVFGAVQLRRMRGELIGMLQQ